MLRSINVIFYLRNRARHRPKTMILVTLSISEHFYNQIIAYLKENRKLIAFLSIFHWYQTRPICYLGLTERFCSFPCSSFGRFREHPASWWLIARDQVKMSMTSMWMAGPYVAFFSTSSGSSLVESVIRIKGVSFRRVLIKHINDSSLEDGPGWEERTNKCLPLIASIIFCDRSTSRADSRSIASAVWLLVDVTTRPRSSNMPISLYWCNPWSLVECVVSSIFRYSLLMISTTDISRDTVLVDGWKQAEVLVLGDVLGRTDISAETGKVSNTTRLWSEVSCYLKVSTLQYYRLGLVGQY